MSNKGPGQSNSQKQPVAPVEDKKAAEKPPEKAKEKPKEKPPDNPKDKPIAKGNVTKKVTMNGICLSFMVVGF